MKCPYCDGRDVMTREGKYGTFYVCNGCDKTWNDKTMMPGDPMLWEIAENYGDWK